MIAFGCIAAAVVLALLVWSFRQFIAEIKNMETM